MTYNFVDTLSICPNFFDDADIDERIDKEVLRNSILMRCGTLMPVYTNTELFKYLSDNFFTRKSNIITKLLDTTEYEYNPIENYKREEEVLREYDSTTESESETSHESKVAAYDSDSYSPKDQRSINSDDSGRNKIEEKIIHKTTGNIGITSTQHLIKEERKVAKFDIYKWIAIEFEQEFFICVS